jgi:hypothetical protein
MAVSGHASLAQVQPYIAAAEQARLAEAAILKRTKADQAVANDGVTVSKALINIERPETKVTNVPMSPGWTFGGMAIPAGLEPATLCLEVRRESRKPMTSREFCFTKSFQKLWVFLNFCQLCKTCFPYVDCVARWRPWAVV